MLDIQGWCERLLHDLRQVRLATIEEDLGMDPSAEVDIGDGDDSDEWGLWGAMIPAYRKDRASISITCEHSHYAIDAQVDDEHVPASSDLVVEVGVVLPIPEGRQLPAARARVRAALEACVTGVSSTAYPNETSLMPGVYLYIPQCADTLERGIWIAMRSDVLGTAWTPDLVPRAVAALEPLIPTLRHAVGVAQGAIHGTGADLNLEAIQGWMAEYRVWLLRREDGATFGPDWRAPYDLEQADERIEVKSTCSGSPGLMHFSTAEVELALRLRRSYLLVRVTVDRGDRDAVFASLREATPIDVFTTPLPEAAARLGQATGLAAGVVMAAWPEIEGVCRLDRDWATVVPEVRDPLGWLTTVGDTLKAKRAGLTLPFE